ncbi:MAG: DUF1295 domain-containing protein [Candidatus Marinamargulisbacteria bacterium]
MILLDYFIQAFSTCLLGLLIILPIALWAKKPHVFDAFWGMGIPISATLTLLTTSDRALTSSLPLLLMTLWGIRLSGFLIITRIITPHNDSRYGSLTRSSTIVAMLKQWLIQALLQAVMVLTVFPLMFTAPFQPMALIFGLLLWGTGMVCQSLSDTQLYRHKRISSDICTTGFWKWSRHPNYFFECMIWVGISVLFIGHPFYWISWIGPITIFITTYYITGPFTERLSLKKRGAAFKEYQKKTPYFFPRRPPKL